MSFERDNAIITINSLKRQIDTLRIREANISTMVINGLIKPELATSIREQIESKESELSKFYKKGNY